VNSVILFIFHSVVYIITLNPKGSATAFGRGYTVPILPNLIKVLGVSVSGFGPCNVLFDVSFIHLVVTILSQLKHILGLANEHAHASQLVFSFVVKAKSLLSCKCSRL